MTASRQRRLLLLAWAGADWRIARPLLDAGELPTLASLIADGAAGNLTSLNPHSAPMQWASLLTGTRADRHGVLGAFDVVGDEVRPVSADSLGRKPLPTLLADAGLRARAVGWPLSHPARADSGVVVSDLFANVVGDDTPLPAPADSVAPAGRRADLESLRVHPAELGPDELGFFVTDPAGATDDPHLYRLAQAVARAGTTHAVATALMEDGDWDALLVHQDILDFLGPAFVAALPPRLPYVAATFHERYGGTLAAVYRFLDMQLGRLLELAGVDANVMLVSQRGYRTGGLRPRTPEVAAQGLAAPWLRGQGMLVMRGPDVAPMPRLEGASLLDVAPTALALLGLPAGRDMDGRVLRAALTAPPPERIGSHETPAASRDTPTMDQRSRADLLAALHLTGESPADEPVPAAEQVRRMRDFNLAISHLDAGRADHAEPLLARLAADQPDDDRLKIHLARARQALGDEAGALDLYAQVTDQDAARPAEQMRLASLALTRGEHARALTHLFRAEQAEPNDAAVHARIGEVYLRMHRWSEAHRAFGRALALDADDAVAHHGRAIAFLGERRYAEAAEAALTSVGLRHHAPRAHHHLGVALAGLGRIDAARHALETALEQDARLKIARRRLIDLLAAEGGDPDRLALHRRVLAEQDATDILRQRRA